MILKLLFPCDRGKGLIIAQSGMIFQILYEIYLNCFFKSETKIAIYIHCTKQLYPPLLIRFPFHLLNFTILTISNIILKEQIVSKIEYFYSYSTAKNGEERNSMHVTVLQSKSLVHILASICTWIQLEYDFYSENSYGYISKQILHKKSESSIRLSL